MTIYCLDVLLSLFGASLLFHIQFCYFLTCIQISQEAGQVVWYSLFLKNFPQFIVIHTVKGFGIVNKAEVDVILELSFFFDDPTDVDNLISGSSAFSKSSLNIWKFMVHILLKPGLENFEHYFTSRGAQLASNSRADPRALASTFHQLLCIYLSRLQHRPHSRRKEALGQG